jgi:transposase
MFAGIDVSKDWFDVAWLVEGQLRSAHFDYSDQGIEQLLEQVPQGHTFVMEATGTYHVQLALKLVQAARQVSVVNPLVIKRYAQMKLKRVKTDRADAQLIMRYGYSECPPLWAPAHEEVQELQQAHGWLHDLITERTRLLNRQQAHARRAKPSEFVVSQMQLQLQQLNQRIKQCEQHLEDLVKKSFAELYARLMSIPSIGKKTALEMIIITDGFTRFDDVKQLCAYVGVSPTTYSSGSSIKGRGSIAKLGQPRMRQLIYLCSWTAKTRNPACQQLHERMSTLGRPKKVINIAIAHKLLRQAWAVATQKVYFSPEFA